MEDFSRDRRDLSKFRKKNGKRIKNSFYSYFFPWNIGKTSSWATLGNTRYLFCLLYSNIICTYLAMILYD